MLLVPCPLTPLCAPWPGPQGPLPASWSALTSLVALELRYNAFEGELPPAWASLTALQSLRLRSNGLTGEGHRRTKGT